MFCDSHIHVGQFYDIYTSPDELVCKLRSLGIDYYAVSSTTTCEENYEKVLKEMTLLDKISDGHLVAVLWVTPKLLQDSTSLSMVLDSGIHWRCVKVHPQLSPEDWYAKGTNYKKVVSLAQSLNVPILIHTGVVKNCHPLHILPLLLDYPDQRFILAHGRPLEETLSVLVQCSNAWVDSAFMPVENIMEIIKKGFVERLLWGSDFPIIKFQERGIDELMHYKSIVSEVKTNITPTDYNMITSVNFFNVFNLS